MIIKFTVSQEDIDLGLPMACTSQHCPVARALRPLLKEGCFLTLGVTNFTFGRSSGVLPYELCVYIRRILHNPSLVKPETFTIDIPNDYLRPEATEGH